jgi:hypothetical protein
MNILSLEILSDIMVKKEIQILSIVTLNRLMFSIIFLINLLYIQKIK